MWCQCKTTECPSRTRTVLAEIAPSAQGGRQSSVSSTPPTELLPAAPPETRGKEKTNQKDEIFNRLHGILHRANEQETGTRHTPRLNNTVAETIMSRPLEFFSTAHRDDTMRYPSLSASTEAPIASATMSSVSVNDSSRANRPVTRSSSRASSAEIATP